MQSDQLQSFNARVKSINNPRNKSYHDPETGMSIPKRVSNKLILENARGRKVGVGSFLMAMVLGALTFMVAKYARMNLLVMPDVGDTTLIVELIIATILASIIGSFVNQKSMRHMMFQVAGAAIMAVAMHNLVWLVPDYFAMVFSQGFVDQVLATTEPMSLHVRGTTYTI